VNAVLWPTVLEKGSWSGEMRLRHFKTGDPIPIFYSAFRIDDPKTGRPVNVGNVCSDITDRKRAEEKLRASEQRLLNAQMELAHVTRVTTLGELTASIAHEVNQRSRRCRQRRGLSALARPPNSRHGCSAPLGGMDHRRRQSGD